MFAKNVFSSLTRFGFGIMAAGVAVAQFFFTIDAGERGILFDRLHGVKPRIYGEGMHFRIPIIQIPKLFEIRSRPKVIYSSCGTKDLQIVNVSLRILFRPKTEFLPEIFLKIGEDYERRILPSLIKEILKEVTAKYSAAELLLERRKVSKEIGDKLNKRFAEFHIILDDAALTHVNFSDVYTRAIENKQIAAQNAEKYQLIKW